MKKKAEEYDPKKVIEILKECYKEGDKFNTAFGDIIRKTLKDGHTPSEAMGLQPGYLENIYAQAYRLYKTGKYSEAAHLFRLLIMFNSLEAKYVMGLAACHHMMKEYVNAIQSYTFCTVLDPKNPIPHFHSSDCYMQLKEYLSAMLSLQLAIDSADKPEYAVLKERALLSLEGLKQQALEQNYDELPESNRQLKERLDII